jgi:hypothetical protein
VLNRLALLSGSGIGWRPRLGHAPTEGGIVACGGTQAARMAAAIIREELGAGAMQINCGVPEMPGLGHWPVLYAANDTGNTGVISWKLPQRDL